MITSYRNSKFNRFSRKRKRYPVVIFIAAAVIASVIVFKFLTRETNATVVSSPDTDVHSLWNEQKYEEVNGLCELRLTENPMDIEALTLNGFAYFYRGITKFTLEDQLPLFEKAVVNLRKAEIKEDNPYYPQVNYVLGKTYYNKGKYYSDLSIKYLESSLASGYTAVDIFEYLGLSYHAIGNYRQALEYFLKAEKVNPSDLLFLAIGQTYVITENYDDAQKYLENAISTTEDQNVIQKGLSLLGQLFIEKKDYNKAISQYEEILKINPRSADAYYHLGVIYDTIDEPVKARAQWRKAVDIEPTHHGALLKLYN